MTTFVTFLPFIYSMVDTQHWIWDQGSDQRYLYTLDRKRADKNDILVERET